MPVPPMRPVAVVLLSGGIDSATALAVARSEGFDAAALSLDYGQRHRAELDAAAAVASALGAVQHKVVRVDLRSIGGSALTDDAVAVPKDASDAGRPGAPVPVTYVPARNLIFLSIAAAWAETLGSGDLYIGANAVDYSGYPDCREPFLRAFETAATLGTRAGAERGRPLRVHAPLVSLTKAQIIRLGAGLGVDYALTRSCYDPVPDDERGGGACGRCDSCIIRARGFREAGIADPTRYAAHPGPGRPA